MTMRKDANRQTRCAGCGLACGSRPAPGDMPNWGTELDFSAARPLNDRYSLLLKAALYDADQHSSDTTKFRVMLTGNY